MNRQTIIYAGAILASLVVARPADAAYWTVDKLVRHADGSPFRCDVWPKHRYGPKQNKCIVRVVFRREPHIGREAAAVIECETGGTWNERSKNRNSTASGLAQFLTSTWRHTKYANHSVFHPVYNVLAMRSVRLADGSWRQWVCKP